MGLISRVSSRTYRSSDYLEKTQKKKPKKRCLSPSTFCIQACQWKSPSTRKSDSCNRQTHFSWTSNARAASRSELFSATRRPLLFVRGAISLWLNQVVVRLG